MFDITTLFASKAKIAVLRALYYQSTPLPLRHVALLAGTNLYSVQRALQQLVEEKIVTKKRQGKYRLFSLDKDNLYYPFLASFFDLEMKNQTAFLSARYHQKAQGMLDFSSAAQRFIGEVRSWI